MRSVLLLLFINLPAFCFAQRTVSASSDWQRLQLNKSDLPKVIADTTTTGPVSMTTSASPRSVALIELFTSNRRNWLVGQRSGYQFEIANGGYTIRKQDANRTTPALCYIMLPNDINLNKAESFTITVDMISSPSEPIDAGLAIGIRDIENYAQFRVSKQTLIIKVLANGTTFASYMPGTPIPMNSPLSIGKNSLMIEKRTEKLHFYLNGNEVPTSPYDFRTFRGNGVGFLTASPVVTFQNLKVDIGTNP